MLTKMNEKLIKIEARHAFTLFPRYPAILGTEDNKYGIVKWNVLSVIEGDVEMDKNDITTITGTYEEEIDPTKNYTILAKEVIHEKYGKQYELLFIGEVLNLSSIGHQKAFLSTFLSEGQITEMYKIFDNPLKVIQEHDIESLKKVHGVGNYIGNCIVERFEECKDNCALYVELDGLGLTPKFIQKLIGKYKNPNTVIQIVKENPYRLSFDIEGIGFKTADSIALKQGISPTSPERIKGYINYLLTELGENGNSYVTSGELTSYIFDQFGGKDNILEIYYDENDNVVGNNIGTAIDDLIEKDILRIDNNESKSMRKVYLKKYWELENEIATHLKRLAKAENKFVYDDWEQVIKEQENKQGWTFTAEQKNGIKLGLDNQICFITGGAGTGKSSLVSGILESLKNYSFAQTALAGKASARLQEVTGKEGYTIHRLLGFKPPHEFKFNEDNPLPYDIIILDEISLVGGEIFLSLLKAIPDGTKLIILGDMGQLESIGCMNLAHDLYESSFIPTVELKEIHRQAQKSGIVLASKAIREKEELFQDKFEGELVLGELQDMYFEINPNRQEIKSDVIEQFKKWYNNDIVKDIMDIQILAPVKKRGDASVFNLNQEVQEFLNPSQPLYKKELKIEVDKQSKEDKSFILREGDKVMCIKNNYKLFNTQEQEAEVFNGWTGILKEIDVYQECAHIYFPIINDTIIFPMSDLKKDIILGYASTVHKFQGSSAKVVIGVLDYSTPPNMRTKELLYTAITRAELIGVIVGQAKAINEAIENSGISDKNTFLVDLLAVA